MKNIPQKKFRIPPFRDGRIFLYYLMNLKLQIHNPFIFLCRACTTN